MYSRSGGRWWLALIMMHWTWASDDEKRSEAMPMVLISHRIN